MKYGLEEKVFDSITSIFAQFNSIKKVLLYGSRAKGNYRNGSDIDITLFGSGLTLSNSVYLLMDKLDELYLPYSFDISIYEQIDNTALKEHIDRVGQVIYEKKD